MALKACWCTLYIKCFLLKYSQPQSLRSFSGHLRSFCANVYSQCSSTSLLSLEVWWCTICIQCQWSKVVIMSKVNRDRGRRPLQSLDNCVILDTTSTTRSGLGALVAYMKPLQFSVPHRCSLHLHSPVHVGAFTVHTSRSARSSGAQNLDDWVVIPDEIIIVAQFPKHSLEGQSLGLIALLHR